MTMRKRVSIAFAVLFVIVTAAIGWALFSFVNRHTKANGLVLGWISSVRIILCNFQPFGGSIPTSY